MATGRPGGTGPLLIPRDIHDRMVEHCLREVPREACGLLGGPAARVDAIYPLTNVARNAEVRYDADPQELINAVVEMRGRGADILAIYHSHPRWRAVPSQTDLDRNYHDDTPRIIVGLIGPVPEVRIWRLKPESYEELSWRLLPVEPPPASG